MSKLVKIFFVLTIAFFAVESSYAQKRSKGENYHENQNPFGKKRKEKKNQSRVRSKRGGLFKKNSSAGNADAFAGNSIVGRKSFISKIFGGGGSSNSKNASLRKTKPGKTQNKEQSKLFRKHSNNNKSKNSRFLHRQNKERSSRRSRGNAVFHKKKR